MKALQLRLFIIGLLTLAAAYYVTPSIIYFSSPRDVRNSDEELSKRIPKWAPKDHVKLGLDLQGGVQLVLGVTTDDAVDTKLGRVAVETARWAKDNNLKIKEVYNVKGKQILRVDMEPGSDAEAFRTKFKSEHPDLVVANRTGDTLDFSYEAAAVKRIKEGAIEQAERVIRSRVDKWGVTEPVINRRVADNSVLVQLPGFKDPSKAKELLGRTAQLQFKIVDDEFRGLANLTDLPAGITAAPDAQQPALQSENKDELLKFARTKMPEGREVYVEKERLAGGAKARYTTLVVKAATEFSGEDILDAFYAESTEGLDRKPEVGLRFTGAGGNRFAEVTGANVNKRMAILVDDEVESAPVIQGRIAGGSARITLGGGRPRNELMEEANQLSLILKSGALPATIEVLEERQVGATLGPELADEGISGALVGLILVFLFMIGYYRWPGVIACVALGLNGLFLLAMMAAMGFALTLPGIAGFILTLGMAVDSNVLINERIREELAAGKNTRKALDIGFSKVFWTIVDANVTTLIAALVLLETSTSGPVRGFAVTLILGILVSLFTSLYCTKTLFEYIVGRMKTDQQIRSFLAGWGGDSKRDFNFNFLGYGAIAATLGVGLIAVVCGLAGVRGMNWGVDFAGGTEMALRFAEPVDPSAVAATAESVGIKDVSSQAVGGDGSKELLVRFGKQGDTAAAEQASDAVYVQKFREAIASSFADKKPEVLQVDYVGPQVGKELRNQGIMSVIYAILGVLVYVALRFDVSFGPGAIAKMITDTFVIIGLYAVFNLSFDLTSVAAFLTVVGYSVNDTIVIFDRIRENLVLQPKRNLRDTINRALNETLGRSINTSVATGLSLAGMLFFTSGQIWNFSLAMLVGVVAATLTTSFLSSAVMLWFENWRRSRGVSAKPATAAAT